MTRWYQNWSTVNGRVDGPPITTDEARARFDTGKTITQLHGKPEAINLAVRISHHGRLVKVTWLDALHRPKMTYTWSVQASYATWPRDKLLLKETHWYEYDHDRPLPEGLPTFDEIYHFMPDAQFIGQRSYRNGGDREEREGTDRAMIHIEEVPSFEHWDPLLTYERPLQPDDPTPNPAT